MFRADIGASRGLRWAILALAATCASGRPRNRSGRRTISPAPPRRRLLPPALCGDRGRRQFRPGAARRQCRQPAPSRLAHQDHDALPAVRADRSGKAPARLAAPGLRRGGVPGADQARRAARPDHHGGGCDQGPRDQIGQRRRRRDRRGDRRRRGHLRQDDDAQGARARHDQHALPQRLGPAGRRAGHHGARPGPARARHPGTVSALLPLFRDPQRSIFAAVRCAITTASSAGSKASMASRPATPARRASTS